MKVKDVPQDSKYFNNTVVRDIAYAVQDDGEYTSVISEGWEGKNDALDLMWDVIREKSEENKLKFIEKTLSPLAYHLEMNIMSISLFAKYTGQSKRKIKKHLKPEHFNNLDDSVLQKYAEVLRISIEELKTVP